MKFNGINVRISPSARLGKNVRIGDGTVIHDNVVIGDNTTIANDCVIGEPTGDYYSNQNYSSEPTTIGENSLIRSHAIIYAGVNIGDGFESGHRITIREKSVIGKDCRIGTNCDLQGYLTMGDHCRLHSNVHLCQFSKLGDYVFIYPNVVLANDVHPPTTEVKGPTIGDFTQVGVQSTIIGNVSIGSNCLIGANSVVTKDFNDFSFILGTPAKRKSDVREMLGKDGKPLYPWKDRFSRGMPWESK